MPNCLRSVHFIVSLIGAGLVFFASELGAQGSTERILEQPPFEVYSAFWPNLHHVLYSEAWRRRNRTRSLAAFLREPLGGELTTDERGRWDAAVAYYDRELADLSLLFEMDEIRQALTVADEDLADGGLATEHRAALTAAAPVYRKHWWAAHDRANRDWIAEAIARIASLSPAVPERLARLYQSPWFDRPVRVDVVSVASRQGAYSALDPEPDPESLMSARAHITISSGEPNNQGWRAAEILFHEASHALIFPIRGAIRDEASAQQKDAQDLWHVALFYLTGEVVRQTLAAREIDYEPYMYHANLFAGGWAGFKQPLEMHWRAYIDGELSLNEAVRALVADIE
jgi:hypothetical protein